MKKTITLLFTLALVSISYLALTYGSGPPVSRTNAPGEANCTACHGGSLVTSGNIWKDITLTSNWHSGGYEKDSIYDITIKTVASSVSRWGFEVTALDTQNNFIGSFKSTGSRTNVGNGSVSGKTRSYVYHTSSGTNQTSTNTSEWEFEWKAPSNYFGKVTFYVVVNHANGNFQSSGDKIFAKTFDILPSGVLPLANILTSDTTICQGESIDFKGSGSGGPLKYNWVIKGGSPFLSSTQNPNSKFNVPGKYVVTLETENKYGKSDPDTVLVTVGEAPDVFLTGINSDTLWKCENSQVNLSVPFSTNATYLWSPGNQTTNSISVANEGTYFVYAEDKNSGCNATSKKVVVANYKVSKPTFTLSGINANDSICANNALQFHVDNMPDSVFVYNNGQMLFATDTFDFELNLMQDAKLKLMTKTAQGCASEFSDEYDVYVDPNNDVPTVQCAVQDVFSLGLTWSDNGNYNSYELSVDSGKSWMNVPQDTGSMKTVGNLVPDKDYTVFVRANKTGPCIYGAIGVAQCKTVPCNSINAQLDYDVSMCAGDMDTIVVRNLYNNNFSVRIEGGNYQADSIVTFIPLAGKSNYLIEIIDSAYLACPATERTAIVQVNEIGPIALIPDQKDVTLCFDETLNVEATDGYNSYQYFANNQLFASADSNSVIYDNVTDQDEVYVVVEEGSCSDTTEILTISKNAEPNTGFTYTRNGSEYSFTPSDNALASYQWDFGDGNSSADLTPTNDFSSDEGKTLIVTLTVEDADGCESSDTQQIHLPKFSNVRTGAIVGLEMYPNPANETLNIELNHAQQMEINLFDLSGKHLQQLHIEKSVRIDTKQMENGVYFIEFKDERGEIQRAKFVVKH